MEIIFYFFVFLFGLCIGSFLNVLIYRLPQSLPITGRSFCPKCKKKITWYDNIPLVSFILLKARCRQCHSPISWQYPVVELLTGILFVIVFYNVTMKHCSIVQLFYFYIIASLIVIFFTDLQHKIIPDQIVYSAIIISLLYRFFSPNPEHWSYFLSGALAALFFFFLFLITRGRGMGLGDVKLAGLMGLVLGWPKIVVALYLAFLTGANLGVILVLRGKKKLSSHIPFGPFLAASTILSLFFGEAIWQKITGLL